MFECYHCNTKFPDYDLKVVSDIYLHFDCPECERTQCSHQLDSKAREVWKKCSKTRKVESVDVRESGSMMITKVPSRVIKGGMMHWEPHSGDVSVLNAHTDEWELMTNVHERYTKKAPPQKPERAKRLLT